MVKLIKSFFRIIILLIILCFVGYCFLCVNYPTRHRPIVEKYSKEYDLDPALIYAVINTESGFDIAATSSKGARGLMQLMPDTIDWIVSKLKIENFSYQYAEDPDTNIKLGSWLLHYLIQYYEGDEELAIAAYNAGHGTVNSWLSNEEVSSDGTTLNKIPYSETKKYVRRVETNKLIYTFILKCDIFKET